MSNAKQHDPRTKTSIIQGHMAAGDWRNAIRVAARLPRLDKHRRAILDAQGAYENPHFYTQIGKDAETLIEAGATALCERFGQESKTMDPDKRNYSNASNARRAAKAAGLSEFDVYKVTNGTYKIRSAATRAAIAKTKAAKVPKAANGRKLAGKRAAVLAAAQTGKLPPPPDFSAATHARYRESLGLLVNLAKAGDLVTLKRMVIKPYSSSPKAMAKYRDLAVIALEARRAAEPEATAA